MSAEDVIAEVILSLSFSAPSVMQGVELRAGPGEVHHLARLTCSRDIGCSLHRWHHQACPHVPTGAYACSAKSSESTTPQSDRHRDQAV